MTKNLTVSSLRIPRRTITRCDAQAQAGHPRPGFIRDDRTDVVIVIVNPSQRRIANLNLRSRFDGPLFLLEFAVGSLLSRGCREGSEAPMSGVAVLFLIIPELHAAPARRFATYRRHPDRQEIKTNCQDE